MSVYGKSSCALLLAAGLAAAIPAHAEDFSLQLQLSHDQANHDAAGLADADSTSFNATYYFDPVVTDGMPVPEAAFVTRKSYLNAAMSRTDLGGAEGDVLVANAAYHVPDTIFFGRVGLVRDDFGASSSDSSWNGTLGIVPVPRLSFGTDFHEDGYDPNVSARYAGKLPNGRWFSASVSAVDPDAGDTAVGFQADYYLDGIAFGGGFSSGSDRWNVRVDKGLPHGFGFLVRYYSEDGGNGVGAMLTWRDL
jgi:hypothetical protein